MESMENEDEEGRTVVPGWSAADLRTLLTDIEIRFAIDDATDFLRERW